MANKKLEELNKIFKLLSEARRLNLSYFPYSEVRVSFKHKLIECLKEEFGDDIQFDREETPTYIHAHYKGVGIGIDISDGFIFAVVDEKEANLVEDFKPIFNKIMGSEPICSYQYHSKSGEEKTVYPTFEWNLDPERRLFELVCFKNYDGCIKNLEDNYNQMVVRNLGEDLFTIEGYKKLFNVNCTNSVYTAHKVAEIHKQNLDVSMDAIYAWINSIQKSLDFSVEKAYKKSLYR